MARLNWDSDRRRKLAREAAAPKSYEEREREREVARATSRFFAQHPSTSSGSRPKATARRLKGSSTTKLPFLATINAGGRVHTVEVGRYGVRFVGPGEREAYTQSS
jgi:hypothetical protein